MSYARRHEVSVTCFSGWMDEGGADEGVSDDEGAEGLTDLRQCVLLTNLNRKSRHQTVLWSQVSLCCFCLFL